MSTSNSDAVLDRILTRIVFAGTQRTQGSRSPRGLSSVLQRDGGSARGAGIGVERRRASAKLLANYRQTNPAFGSSSARDSSLAGTNTVVPQVMFSKGMLRPPVSLGLQWPTATASTASRPNDTSAASAKTALIFRQQIQRHNSPQPHLRAARCSSPPPDITCAPSRGRASPVDVRASSSVGAVRGAHNSGSSPHRAFACGTSGTGSPRITGNGRCRSSPRDRPGAAATDGGHHNGDGGAAASAASELNGRGDGGGQLPSRGRPGNTITRTAALRALKQQRSTTPDIIAEVRSVAIQKATHSFEGNMQTAQHTTLSIVTEVNPGGGAVAPQQEGQQQLNDHVPPAALTTGVRAAGPAAKRNTGGGVHSRTTTPGEPGPAAQQCSSTDPSTTRMAVRLGPPTDPLPHPPMQQAVAQPQSHPLPKRVALQDFQGPVLKQPKQQHPMQQQHPTLPAQQAIAETGTIATVGVNGCKPPDSSQVMLAGGASQQPSSAGSTSAVRTGESVWGLTQVVAQELSFRSPSPRRAKDRASNRIMSAALPDAVSPPTVAFSETVAPQRKKLAMRQHVVRRNSPSPDRSGCGPCYAKGDNQAGLPSSPSRQAELSLQQALAGDSACWQKDLIMAAQTRIRRLEEQVVSLSAQLTELHSAHADLEFQLEEEQQHARSAGASVPAAAAGAPSGVSKGVSPPRPAGQPQPEHQGRELQERARSREAALEEQLVRARVANDTLVKQNRALYGTLEETLSAAEHAAQELKQLRAAHAQLQEGHDAAQKEMAHLKEDLELRERALSAVQAEFNALRRRHDEMMAAAEAARREAALRDGRLRREMEASVQEAATIAAQLSKLQREHHQLHSRKAEKDRQLAALAKRADAQQEQLAGAERLAQEQTALVRELESRATLLRNRNSALDRAVAAEKEVRQGAQEQLRRMEEEIALLVSIVRQSDPNLETLARYKGDPVAAAAMAAAAAAAAAAALLQASPSPTRSGHSAAAEDGRRPEGGGECTDGALEAVAPLPYNVRGAVGSSGSTGTPPLPFPIPGSVPLSVRAPAPAAWQPPAQSTKPQPHHHHHYLSDAVRLDSTATAAAAVDGAGMHQPSPPRTAATVDSPMDEPEAGMSRPTISRRYPPISSRDGSPLGMLYPCKHNMTGGVFLDVGGHRSGAHSSSPLRIISPVAPARLRAVGGSGQGQEHGGGSPCGVGQNSRLPAATAAASVPCGARIPPGRRASSAIVQSRSRSDTSGTGFAAITTTPALGNLAVTWSGGDNSSSATKPIGNPVWRGAGIARRSATPPGMSAIRRGRDARQGGMLGMPAYMVEPILAASSAATDGGAVHGEAAPSASAAATADASNARAVAQANASTTPHLETAYEVPLNDRVFWAKPRRGSRYVGCTSDGSGSGMAAVVATDTWVGTQPTVSSSAAAVHRGQRAAQRALETSALLMAAAPEEEEEEGSHNRSRSCAGLDWVRYRLSLDEGTSRRRVSTPEPRTAAAWLKLSDEAVAAAAVSSHKRYHTPQTEISSTGRGAYKLGPPRGYTAAMLTASAPPPSVHIKDTAPGLAALLQQHKTGLSQIWSSGRDVGSPPLRSTPSPYAAGLSADNNQQRHEPQSVILAAAGRGTALHQQSRSAAVSEAAAAGRIGGGNLNGDSAVQDGALGVNKKTEVATPVGLLHSRPMPSGVIHSRDRDDVTDHDDSSSPDGLVTRSITGGNSPNVSPSFFSRPSSTIRASYAFDSPLNSQQQQRQTGLAAGLCRGSPSSSSSLGVGGNHGGVGGSDGHELDSLGIVLRSLQLRQAALLQQLTGSGTGGSVSAAAKQLPAGSHARSTQEQALGHSDSARTPQGPSSVTSFTFANLKKAVEMTTASPDMQLEDADDGDGREKDAVVTSGVSCSESKQSSPSHDSGPLRRRSVSFLEDNNPPEETSRNVVRKPSPPPACSDSCPRQEPLKAPSCWRQPTPPPPLQPTPPRSPHRPSVTAAAAAAVAAGAGVGGPLTALLDQLENSVSERLSCMGSGPSEPGVSGAVSSPRPLPPSLQPPPPPRQHAEEQLETHFCVAEVLQATAVGHAKVLEQRRQQYPHLHHLIECKERWQEAKQDLPWSPGAGLAAQGLLAAGGVTQPRTAGERHLTVGDDDDFEKQCTSADDCVVEAGGVAVQEDVQVVRQGRSSQHVVQLLLPVAAAGAAGETEAEGDHIPAQDSGVLDAGCGVDNALVAAAPPSPQRRDERSMGGSEPYADEDYPFNTDISRLGVSLYDNVAYDISRAASARADYYMSGGGGPGQTLRTYLSSTPVICVPTSLVAAATAGATSSNYGMRDRLEVAETHTAAVTSQSQPLSTGTLSISRGPHVLMANAEAAVGACTRAGDLDAGWDCVLDMALLDVVASASPGRPSTAASTSPCTTVRTPSSVHAGHISPSRTSSPPGSGAGWQAERHTVLSGDTGAARDDDVTVEAVAEEGETERNLAEWLSADEESDQQPYVGVLMANGGRETGAMTAADAAVADVVGIALVKASVTEWHPEGVRQEAGERAGGRPPSAGVNLTAARMVQEASAEVTSAELPSAVPGTPLQAAGLVHAVGGSSSSCVSLPLSSSSQTNATGSVCVGAGSSSSGSFLSSTITSVPLQGSWRLGRTEPKLLDRPLLAHSSLLSISRTCLGLSNVASISSSGGGATASCSTSGSHDWLQQRRPASPSVKPLCLAEVLRRPPSNSAR